MSTVKLTLSCNAAVFVNPEHVTSISPYGPCESIVRLVGGGGHQVVGTPDKVRRLLDA